MIWLWIVIGLVALVAAILLVGLLLPKAYGSTAQIRLRKPPEEVWQAITDYRQHPMTGSMRKNLEDLAAPSDSGPVWKEDMGSSAITIRTIEAQAPHRLVRSLQDSVVPMTSRWEYEIEADGAGSKVSIREAGNIDNGTWHVPIFRIMVRLMSGAGARAYLDSLAKTFGEDTKAA